MHARDTYTRTSYVHAHTYTYLGGMQHQSHLTHSLECFILDSGTGRERASGRGAGRGQGGGGRGEGLGPGALARRRPRSLQGVWVRVSVRVRVRAGSRVKSAGARETK